jgi:hypothetical protein
MAAGWTITALNLDDARLVEMRRAAIEAWGLSLTSADPLPRDDVARAIGSARRRNREGRFEPFCVAIWHAAVDYITLLEKDAGLRKRARRKRRSLGR